MARKKKGELPSGNVRIQIYDYTDENGKKHYKSFTAPTRAQAQAMATEWKNNRRELKEALTVATACEKYIEMKRNVLSPYTVTGYEAALKRIKKYSVSKIDLSVIKNEDLQLFISSMKVAPKTAKNTMSLISSAMGVFLPNFSIDVTFPAKSKPNLYIPTSVDVQKLLDNCNTTELKLAVLFAAVGTMRRSEIAAVKFSDVDYKKNLITVYTAMAKVGNHSEWIIKSPKTYHSSRKIRMPKYAIEMIKKLDTGEREFVIGLTPDQIYDRFSTALKNSGLPSFRFHDLRHYAASQMHADGIPERYIEAMGGWKPGSTVLKRVYETAFENEMIQMGETFAENSKFTV